METTAQPEGAITIYFVTIQQCTHPLRRIATLYYGRQGWKPDILLAYPFTRDQAITLSEEITGAAIEKAK